MLKVLKPFGRAFALVLVFSMFAQAAFAQPATPSSSPAAVDPVSSSRRLDLAAMALNSSDLPAEFGLLYEVYLPGANISDLLVGGKIPQADLDATGLKWYYESIYSTPDGGTRIRSYLEEYSDDLGAARGFNLLENETVLAPEGATLSDSPGPGIGEEPSEITEGTLQQNIGNQQNQTVDVTFRVGRVIGGVSVDTDPGIEADRDLAIDLCRRLDERINAVFASEAIDLINTDLPHQLVSLGPDWNGRDEGYMSSPEMLGPDLGPEFIGAFKSGYFRSQVYGQLSSQAIPLPLVSISVAQFTDETGPLALLSRLNEFQPEFVGLERVTTDRIPGTSAAVAFRYANTIMAGSQVDSFRVVMIVDSSLVTLDVQGNKTVEGAEEAGLAIAAAQAVCLHRETECSPVDLENGVLAAPESGPGGQPVG